ncbi:hypothetical protein BJY52DRAFT_1232354 [Lactarius psammicola]|nr:hypothetical protein BJY52DRAFT_1232354 [Lactarius psammicola]
MAPRTRRQKSSKQKDTSTTTTPVAPAADVSGHLVSCGGGGAQRAGADRYKLPPIVIRKPHAAVAERTTKGKRARPMSSNEGPTSSAEQTMSRSAKRVKSSPVHTHPPQLELTDGEDDSTTASFLKTQVGDDSDEQSRCGKPLRRCTESESDASDTESSEGDKPEPPQKRNGKLCQTTAFERPSWPASTTNGAANQMAISPDSDADIVTHLGGLSEGTHSQGVRTRESGFIDNPAHCFNMVTRSGVLSDNLYAGTRSKGFHAGDSGLTSNLTHHFNVGTHSEGRRAGDLGLTNGPTHRSVGTHSKGHCADDSGFTSSPTRHSDTWTHSESRHAGDSGFTSSPARHPDKGTRFEGYSKGFRKCDPARHSDVGSGSTRTNSGHHRDADLDTTDTLGRNRGTTSQWPPETSLIYGSNPNKIRLTDQNATVRATITGAFSLLHKAIIFQHAFPDVLMSTKFIRVALLEASSSIPAARDIHNWIVHNHVYFTTLSTLPRPRISLFRAEVKECCIAAITPRINSYGSTVVIADVVHKQLMDYNYIYPRRSNSTELGAPPHRGRPYRNLIIVQVIRELYFMGPTSFFTRHEELFPYHLGTDGEIIREVPKVMVALVATAYYAALNEWHTGERKPCDFTANMNLDVYDSNIWSLNKIETQRTEYFHKMMADIFKLAINGSLAANTPSQSVTTLDLSLLED